MNGSLSSDVVGWDSPSRRTRGYLKQIATFLILACMCLLPLAGCAAGPVLPMPSAVQLDRAKLTKGLFIQPGFTAANFFKPLPKVKSAVSNIFITEFKGEEDSLNKRWTFPQQKWVQVTFTDNSGTSTNIVLVTLTISELMEQKDYDFLLTLTERLIQKIGSDVELK